MFRVNGCAGLLSFGTNRVVICFVVIIQIKLVSTWFVVQRLRSLRVERIVVLGFLLQELSDTWTQNQRLIPKLRASHL